MKITCLHIFAALNGFCLLILASTDTYYGDTYNSFDIVWRKSFLCNAISIITLLSNIMIEYVLGLIAIARILVIKYPMSTRIKQPWIVVRIVTTGFLIILTFVVSLYISNVLLSGTTQPLSLCVLYGIQRNIIHVFGTASYGLLQLCSVLIPAFYFYVILLLCKNTGDRELGVSRDYLSKSVFIQLLLINFSHIACWLPTAIVMFIALSNKEYPIYLLNWVVLIITPLNSLLNPFLLRIFKLLSKK